MNIFALGWGNFRSFVSTIKLVITLKSDDFTLHKYVLAHQI